MPDYRLDNIYAETANAIAKMFNTLINLRVTQLLASLFVCAHIFFYSAHPAFLRLRQNPAIQLVLCFLLKVARFVLSVSYGIGCVVTFVELLVCLQMNVFTIGDFIRGTAVRTLAFLNGKEWIIILLFVWYAVLLMKYFIPRRFWVTGANVLGISIGCFYGLVQSVELLAFSGGFAYMAYDIAPKGIYVCTGAAFAVALIFLTCGSGAVELALEITIALTIPQLRPVFAIGVPFTMSYSNITVASAGLVSIALLSVLGYLKMIALLRTQTGRKIVYNTFKTLCNSLEVVAAEFTRGQLVNGAFWATVLAITLRIVPWMLENGLRYQLSQIGFVGIGYVLMSCLRFLGVSKVVSKIINSLYTPLILFAVKIWSVVTYHASLAISPVAALVPVLRLGAYRIALAARCCISYVFCLSFMVATVLEYTGAAPVIVSALKAASTTWYQDGTIAAGLQFVRVFMELYLKQSEELVSGRQTMIPMSAVYMWALQLLVILIFLAIALKPLWSPAPRAVKTILLGCLIIFFLRKYEQWLHLQFVVELRFGYHHSWSLARWLGYPAPY